MYFNNFDRKLYDFNINGKTKSIAIMDITKNVRARKEILSNITLYDEYDIVDGETPELIAEKFYGKSDYHWIIMLVNERYDSVKDFPQTDRVVAKMIEDKYGSSANDVRHYTQDVNNDGIYYQVDPIFVMQFNMPIIGNYTDQIVKFTISEVSKDPVIVLGTITGISPESNYLYYKTANNKALEYSSLRVVKVEFGAYMFQYPQIVLNNASESFIPVTNSDYEYDLNESKRRIKIISSTLVEQIVKEFTAL